MESKTINITIQNNIFPKLFELDEQTLNDSILYLISIGYQHTYSSMVDKNIVNKVDGICRRFKDDILVGVQEKNNVINNNIVKLDSDLKELNIENKIDEFSGVINKLFGISSTSNKKGEISEDLIYKIISDKYPNYTYDVKRNIPHNADGELCSNTGMRALVEIKNYSNNVHTNEIKKFKYDLKHNNINLGIFLSLKTGIVGKKCIDYEVFQNNNVNYHIIYISRLMDDINKLDCGILLLENLHNIIKNDNIDFKIDQIKNSMYENFTKLEELINKTSELRNNFNILETNIKSSLDIYYNYLREYELDLKQNMQNVWIALFNDLQDINTNFIDEKENVLIKYKKDKCYLILCKLFDIFNKNSINIKNNNSNNIYNLYRKNKNIGSIKKMKDKILFNFSKIKINIPLDVKQNMDKNLKLIQYIITNN